MKNFIKFWINNRFSIIIGFWIIGIIFMMGDNSYMNMFILLFLIFGTLFGCSYIIEDTKMNSSERLLYIKLNKFFKHF